MNSAPAVIKVQDIPFSDEDFKSLATLAKSQFGLDLAESKKPLVYSRLSKRLKARGVSCFPDYLSLLGKPGEDAEKFELISALTTNVTSFFRENHHFETLRDEYLPAIIAKVQKGDRARIWSAGCSAGPEPYSLAMTILDKLPNAHNLDLKILATDIDPKIVEKARKGTYNVEELKGIPQPFQNKWSKTDSAGQTFDVSEDLKRLITFNELNLISEWPFSGKFDVIFCRNVAIYFDQPTQQKLWKRFCELLVPGGLLFIGHSERITGPAMDQLEGIGITSYRKGGIPTAGTQE